MFQLLSLIIISAFYSYDLGYGISGKFYLSTYMILFYPIDFLTGDSLFGSIFELTILLYFPRRSYGSFLLDYLSYFDFLIFNSMSACDFLVLRSLSKYETIWFFYSLTLSFRYSLSFDFYMLIIGSSVVSLIFRSYLRFILCDGLRGSTLPGFDPTEFWVLFIFLIILL